MSSVVSKDGSDVRSHPEARKVKQEFDMKAGFGLTHPICSHRAEANPVSSSSSLRAHSAGLSPGSTIPPGISRVISPVPWRNCLIRTISPDGVTGIMLTQSGASIT